jgi:hypothetical protein
VAYSDTSSVELLLVHLLDGGISLGLLSVGLPSVNATIEANGTHDETETPGSASLLVLHDDTLIQLAHGEYSREKDARQRSDRIGRKPIDANVPSQRGRRSE